MPWPEIIVAGFGVAHVGLMGGIFLRLGTMQGSVAALAERLGRLEEWRERHYRRAPAMGD